MGAEVETFIIKFDIAYINVAKLSYSLIDFSCDFLDFSFFIHRRVKRLIYLSHLSIFFQALSYWERSLGLY